MSHLMTCGDTPNCMWTGLAIPTLAGVNCAKPLGGIYLTVAIEDSMKMKDKEVSRKDPT